MNLGATFKMVMKPIMKEYPKLKWRAAWVSNSRSYFGGGQDLAFYIDGFSPKIKDPAKIILVQNVMVKLFQNLGYLEEDFLDMLIDNTEQFDEIEENIKEQQRIMKEKAEERIRRVNTLHQAYGGLGTVTTGAWGDTSNWDTATSTTAYTVYDAGTTA